MQCEVLGSYSYLSSAMAPMVRTEATTERWDMKFVTRQNLEPKDQSLKTYFIGAFYADNVILRSRISINLTYFSWTRSWKYCWILYLLGQSVPSWRWKSWWRFSFFCFLNIKKYNKVRYWWHCKSLTWDWEGFLI